ncbi:MAG: uncharacterized protein PWQ77_604 [Kosmotogales bacterium]|nr:uncharacterized protein [Kosmotogales bacterium]
MSYIKEQVGVEHMHCAINTYLIKLTAVNSLKEKRMILRKVLSDLKGKFNASVVETGKQDSKYWLEISVALIANSSSEIDSILSSVEKRLLFFNLDINDIISEKW